MYFMICSVYTREQLKARCMRSEPFECLSVYFLLFVFVTKELHLVDAGCR